MGLRTTRNGQTEADSDKYSPPQQNFQGPFMTVTTRKTVESATQGVTMLTCEERVGFLNTHL